MELTIIIILAVLLVLCILFIIYLIQQLSNETNRADEVQENNQLLEAEIEKRKIENLRFALNPHSFRNTLNTIEHLAKNTYESVNSLSGIFDYMLYDATNQFVPLKQELSFAQEYLKLYRLRVKPTTNVKFSVDEKMTDDVMGRRRIEPLICAHFIENAFKHGDLSSDGAFISIKIELINGSQFVYSVRNTYVEKTNNSNGGIGANAFEDRLNLLYNNKHHLEYTKENNVFTANLKLELQ